MARGVLVLLLASRGLGLDVRSAADCPGGGADGRWKYFEGRCFARGGRATWDACNSEICPALANATDVAFSSHSLEVLRFTTSVLACVDSDVVNDFLVAEVAAAEWSPRRRGGSWVGMYQDPHDRKKSHDGWGFQAAAACRGVTYENFYRPWGEPDHHLGCSESCAATGTVQAGLGAWTDESCRLDDFHCLCEWPARPSAELLTTPPFSDRDCGTGQLFAGILILAAVTLGAAVLVVAGVLCANRRSAAESAGRAGVGLFPSSSGGLYQIASGFEGAGSLAVDRSARIVLQLTCLALLLGVIVKVVELALFLALVPREHAVSPGFDLAFTTVFATCAAYMCYMAVKTANDEYACGMTYLQAFQALVWALAASCGFSLLLLALVGSAGEHLDVVGVLLNVAFGFLYGTIAIFALRLQRDVDALDSDAPAPRATGDGDDEAGVIELSDFPEPDSADVFEPDSDAIENPVVARAEPGVSAV